MPQELADPAMYFRSCIPWLQCQNIQGFPLCHEEEGQQRETKLKEHIHKIQ